MKIKEYTNPKEKDYDIKSNLNSFNNSTSVNPYSEQLIDLIGLLEDITEEELKEQYEISMNEYLHPSNR